MIIDKKELDKDKEFLQNIIERDLLFSRYIDAVDSIEKWSEKPLQNTDKKSSRYEAERRRRKSLIEHLENTRDEISQLLRNLDLLISPLQNAKTEANETIQN